MAEVDFDDFEDAVFAPARSGARAAQISRLMNYAGAASSIALILLMAVWGTKLILRDVNGVPVMRALDGPMRMAPADPGGQEASNQGLSVNAIASTGVASPVADTLQLAPAATALTADDAPGLVTTAGAGGLVPMAASDLVGPVQTGVDPVGASPATNAGADPVADAVAAAVAEAVAGLEAPQVSGELGDGLAASPRPVARPGGTVAAASVGASPAASEMDPATIAVGTRMAQLGAFDSPDEARAKWTALAGQFAEVMAGKALVIQPAQSGGKIFYRLRAHGFEAEEDARRFCAVLLAGNTDCIPVAQR